MDRCVCTGSPAAASARPGPPRRGGSLLRRSARAAALAAVGALTAGCSHALTTGTALPLTALAAGGAVALGVVHPLTGRRPSVALGTTALTLLQAVLHLLFAALTPSVPAAHAMATPVHAHATTPGAAGTLVPTLPTLAGHLLAAAALAWLLHRGELAAAQLSSSRRSPVVEALRRAVLALRRLPCRGRCSLPPLPDRAFPPALRPARTAERGVLLAHEVTRRGPPAGVPASG
ncbi:hypothetical protein ACWEQJ_11520 [Streptomyces cyaneofuscatus]